MESAAALAAEQSSWPGAVAQLLFKIKVWTWTWCGCCCCCGFT